MVKVLVLTRRPVMDLLQVLVIFCSNTVSAWRPGRAMSSGEAEGADRSNGRTFHHIIAFTVWAMMRLGENINHLPLPPASRQRWGPTRALKFHEC